MADLADYTHPAAVRQLLESLARVISPPQAAELGLIDDIVDHVELSMRASPKAVRAALLAGMSGYEIASMAYPSHLGTRASKLRPALATAYFDSWFHSNIGAQHEFAKGIKGLIALACYEQPAMMKAIDYTPQEWIDKSIRYRLQTYEAAIAKRAVDIVAPDPLPGVVGPNR